MTTSSPNPEPDLIHLIYASAATRALNRGEVLSILDIARRVNPGLGVTGILLYVGDSFFQVLEGPNAAVTSLYDRIGRDDRHKKVLKLIQEPILARSFADWSMGYAALSRGDLATIPGMNDFFHSKASFLDLGEGRVRSLLDAFAEGRWRARVL
jgi:Sensors of blue-light using FAD